MSHASKRSRAAVKSALADRSDILDVMRSLWPKGKTAGGSTTDVRIVERLRVRVAIGEDPWSALSGKSLVRFRERVWRVTDVRNQPPSAAVYLLEAIPGERDTIVDWDPPSLRKADPPR